MEVAALGLRVDGSPVDKAAASLDRLSDSADRAERSAEGMGKGTDRAGKQAESSLKRADLAGRAVARSFGLITTALAAAAGGFSFGRLVSETAGFEQSLLGLQVVSGATAAEMQQLEQQSRTLGATSMFSAQQAADAQNFLAMAGFSVNETLGATPGILQLAAAGSMDLASAADLASNVLGGFRLEVEELGRVNDVLAAAAAGSNTSIMQLGQAMSFAAPIAAAAGVSIEETAAAIGVLSDAGLQGSRAGTGFLGVIRQLSNLTPAATSALSAYGLTAEDVNIETRGLASVVEALNAANIDAADSFKIFGSEAGPAAQILASGAVRVNEFTGELKLAEDTAQRAAMILGSGLRGSMRSFSSAVGEATLQLGRDSGLSAGLQDVIDTATGVLSVYNDMLPEFAEANDLTEEQTAQLEFLAAGLGSVVTVAEVAAVAIGARLAGSLGLAAAAKIAATREALRYQAALATMAGISGRAAVAQTALATAARGASTALALVGGPLGLLVGAAGLLYVFREELGLTRRQVGLTEEELASLREEMAEASGEELSRSLQQVDQALVQVGLKAAAAREELARLRSESSGSGVLGFEGGRVGEEVRGMQAVAEFTAQITSLEQERAVIARESGSRSFKPLSEWLFEVDDANQAVAGSTTDSTTAVREAQREAERFASALSALQDELFPLEAEQRQYRENQELLNSALEMGEIGLSRYAEAVGRLEESYQNAGDAAEVYGLSVDSAESKASSLNDTARDLGFAFESAFESAIQSGGSLRDVLDGILDDVISIALRVGVTEPLGQAVSGAFKGVDFGSVIGSFFGGGRLNGGPVSPGRVYEVTEDGNPEMLTVGQRNYLLPGSQAGTVTPFSGMPAMGSAPRAASSPVNVYISTPPGTEARTEERQNAQGGRDLHVIIDEITAGNLGNPGSRTGRAMRNVFGAQRNLTGRG